MQSVQANSYNYNDFNFSMQTSSGDNINLGVLIGNLWILVDRYMKLPANT